MKRQYILSLTWITCLAMTQLTFAQARTPNIGYIYPAGGQQGSTFEVLLGGTHLVEPATAHISGGGVEVEIIEYIKPPNQGAFKEMQNKMGELLKKKRAAAPEGWRPGRRAALETFSNENWTEENEAEFTELRRKLAMFKLRRTSAPALAETVRLNVTVDPDAKPGKREIRLASKFGLTNPMVFYVNQLPECSEQSARDFSISDTLNNRGKRGRKNRADARKYSPGAGPITTESETETNIPLPVIINGQILPGDLDRYRFTAKKDQQLVIDVKARTLIPYISDAVPGWFQATVTLSDSDGREIAYNDDFGFRPDPVLYCEIPEDGQYTLEIKDALYRGREDFIYRIALGEIPFVTSVFPLGARSGARTELEFTGWNLPKTTKTHTAHKSGIHPVSMRLGTTYSNDVLFAVDRLPEYIEKKNDKQPVDIQQVKVPVVINGRIDSSGDRDIYSFQAKKGDTISAEVQARRIGSPLDSTLRLTTKDGQQLAFNDDYEDKACGLTTHHADSRLSATIPSTGTYHLTIGDAQVAGGNDYAYRLRLAPQKPDFELRVVPSTINARVGTTVPITVHALRKNGFEGAIDISLKKTAKGFALSGARIPERKDHVRMTLTVPNESREKVYNLSMTGRARINGRKVVHPVVPADDRMQAFIYRHLVPAEEFLVSVKGKSRRIRMNIPDQKPVRIPADGKVSIPINIPERAISRGLTFELNEPPSGITIEQVKPGQRESTIILKCDSALATPGTEGNLIINVFVERKNRNSEKGKEQRKKRIPLSALPAIPFKVVTR